MPRLSPRVSRLCYDDRGAVSVLVAAVLGVGLLLGIGALVIDTGQLYGERAELQNGADAAAFAIAQDCGDTDGCALDPYPMATRYAGANATDGFAAVTMVCGRASRGVVPLPACPAEDSAVSPCLGERPVAGNFVEVRAVTERPGGSRVLPPTFGRVLLGDSYTGRGVLACSRTAWGGPSVAYGFGMTISLCEWQAATLGGTVFAPAPPATVASAFERVLTIHGAGLGCAGGASGWDLPGGFGWLEDRTGHCETQVDVAGRYLDTTGVAASQACRDVLAAAVATREPMLVPIFDGAGGAGNTGYYHLRGFASFVVTGYNLPGASALSTLTGKRLCSGDLKCVYGYFTRDLVPAGAVLGGPDLGATTVQAIG